MGTRRTFVRWGRQPTRTTSVDSSLGLRIIRTMRKWFHPSETPSLLYFVVSALGRQKSWHFPTYAQTPTEAGTMKVRPAAVQSTLTCSKNIQINGIELKIHKLDLPFKVGWFVTRRSRHSTVKGPPLQQMRWTASHSMMAPEEFLTLQTKVNSNWEESI